MDRFTRQPTPTSDEFHSASKETLHDTAPTCIIFLSVCENAMIILPFSEWGQGSHSAAHGKSDLQRGRTKVLKRVIRFRCMPLIQRHFH